MWSLARCLSSSPSLSSQIVRILCLLACLPIDQLIGSESTKENVSLSAYGSPQEFVLLSVNASLLGEASLSAKGLLHEDVSLSAQGSLQEDAFLSGHGAMQDDMFQSVQESLQEDVSLPAQGVLPEDVSLSAQGSLQEDGSMSAQGSLQEDGSMSKQGSLQEDALLSAQGSLQEDATLSAQGSLQEDTLLSAQGSLQEDAPLSAQGSLQEDVSLSLSAGEPVLLHCLEDRQDECPPSCLWEGPGPVFCSVQYGQAGYCQSGGLSLQYRGEGGACSCDLTIARAGQEHEGDWLCALHKHNKTEKLEGKRSAGLAPQLMAGVKQVRVIALGLTSVTFPCVDPPVTTRMLPPFDCREEGGATASGSRHWWFASLPWPLFYW